ncbi:MAG: hypothetical protein Q8N79_00885, partial [Candidatus Methanoperedens sp.]|nr:hypothetical protein [Candidatus Methanoperedens sp.]
MPIVREKTGGCEIGSIEFDKYKEPQIKAPRVAPLEGASTYAPAGHTCLCTASRQPLGESTYGVSHTCLRIAADVTLAGMTPMNADNNDLRLFAFICGFYVLKSKKNQNVWRINMSLTKVNATAATLTKNRTEGSITRLSGMCVTCVDGCIGMCEIGKSAYRGTEVIYPQPFGIITAASEKDYPLDLSHFNILGTAVGAHGIEADSNVAIFPNVDLEVRIGKEKDIKLRLPFIIPGLGSTAVAKSNWDGLAIGAAMSGV